MQPYLGVLVTLPIGMILVTLPIGMILDALPGIRVDRLEYLGISAAAAIAVAIAIRTTKRGGEQGT